MKKKSYLSRQIVAAVVIVTVLAVSLPLYFAVLRPYFNRPSENGTETEPYIEGENLRGNSLRIMTVEEGETTEYFLGKGSEKPWSFYVKDNNIYVRDYELTPCDGNSMIYLHTSLASPMASRLLPTSEELKALRHEKAEKMSEKELEALGGEDRIVITNEDLKNYNLPWEDYGLDDISRLNYCMTTDKNGVTHKIYIGNFTPDGTSRYAMYEGRNAVYVIGSAIAPYYTLTLEEVASPILTVVPENAQSDYVPDTFTIYKGQKAYIQIVRYDPDVALAMDRATNSILMKHIYDDADGNPVYNMYDTSGDYSTMLYNLFRTSLFGKEVVAVSPCEPIIENKKVTYRQIDISEDVLESYGISKEDPYMSFHYKKGNLENLLVFSTPSEDEDGRFFYVYNAQYEFIVKTYAESVPFMEKDETFYMSSFVSLIAIENLDKLTVDSTGLKDKYLNELWGLERIKESFKLRYKMNGTGTEKVLDETGSPTLEEVLLSDGSPVRDAGKTDGVLNFRNLYYYLLRIKMYTNIEEQLEDINRVDLSQPDVSVTYEIYKGKTHQLNFYFYGDSGNLCFYTFDDGKERYVVDSKDVATVIRAVILVQNGQSVTDALGGIG